MKQICGGYDMLPDINCLRKGRSEPGAITRPRLFAYMLVVVSTVLASVLSVLLILGASITHIAAILLMPMVVGVAASAFLSRKYCIKQGDDPSASAQQAEEPSPCLAYPCLEDEGAPLIPRQMNRPTACSPSCRIIPGDLFDDFIARVKTLTPTETEVFRLHGAGKNSSEITGAMFFTINTLKMHNKHIYEKLGVSSKGELLLYIGLIRKSGLGDSIFRSESSRAPLSEG